MSAPYTGDQLGAFMIAETSIAAVLTAVLWQKPLSSRAANVAMVVAIWMAVLAPIEPDLVKGFIPTIDPGHYLAFLRASAFVASLAMLFARPRWIFAFALAGEYVVSLLCSFLKYADGEIAAMHLVYFGILLGLHRLAAPRVPTLDPPALLDIRRPRHDVAIFAVSTIVAALVAYFVLDRAFPQSGDEWAYTYQADLFAHFKAYGTPPQCPKLHMNFWVFYYQGRSFAQYTPGFPLVLAPFMRLGVPWLANPLLCGAMCVGVARVARRAVAGGVGGVHRITGRAVSAAGILAAATCVLGASMILNAGSRYSHTLVCACFVWAVECLCVLGSGERRGKWGKCGWAALLGATTAWMLTTRPADGATLGVGLFLYFVYALVRRRFGLREIVAAAIPFGAIGVMTLLILHAQLGVWMKTGYSITESFHPWAKYVMQPADPGQIKFVFPLTTGAYMWWPAAPALALPALLALRRGAWRVTFMLGASCLPMLVYYFYVQNTHGDATGWGPRFHLPIVAAMAILGGAFLGPLWGATRAPAWGRSALGRGGPAALASVAIVAGVVRLFPLLFGHAHAIVHKGDAPFRAIAKAKLTNAVVTVTTGEVEMVPLDLTQNLPSDPNPDVVILNEFHSAEDNACGKELYKGRHWYRAVGKDEADLQLVE